MQFYKKLSMEQVVQLIENCKYSNSLDNHEQDCENCPINGECLYYYSGDDSLLYEN